MNRLTIGLIVTATLLFGDSEFKYDPFYESEKQTLSEAREEDRLLRERIARNTDNLYKSAYRELYVNKIDKNREDRIKAYSGIPTDSNFEMTAKDVYNSFINWSSKMLTGEGVSDKYLFDINFRGSKISSLNKDLGAYQNKTLKELIDEYHYAKEDPNARHVVYTIKVFDGYDEYGKEKFLYKTGIDKVSAFNRYKEQLDDYRYKIVAEKRFAGAEHWENAFNMLSYPYKALDKGTDKSSGVNFGFGYTELVRKDILGLDNDNIDYRKKREESKEKLKKYIKEGYTNRE